MKVPKIKLKKIKEAIKKLPRILGERAFLFFLALFSLFLIFGGLVYYKYSILVPRVEPEIFESEKPIKFQESTYQEILKIWEVRQKRFEEADLKIYPDPFRAPVLTTTTEGID